MLWRGCAERCTTGDAAAPSRATAHRASRDPGRRTVGTARYPGLRDVLEDAAWPALDELGCDLRARPRRRKGAGAAAWASRRRETRAPPRRLHQAAPRNGEAARRLRRTALL